MPKDYVRRSQTKTKKNHFPWLALLLLCVVVILLAIIMTAAKHFTAAKQEQNSQPLAIVEKAKQPVFDIEKHNPVEHPEQEYSVKFDFYQLLPEQKVQVATTPTEQSSSVSHSYILQLASLTNKEDADNFKEKLQSQGFNVNMVPINQGNHLWYRIQMGPFSNKDKAMDLQTKLQDNNVYSIIILAN